jgi:cytochrome b
LNEIAGQIDMNNRKVWDLPVRICHWGFVLIIVFQYLSAEILDDNWLPNTMQWHFYAGYTCIALIIFRLCWGIFGTYYAKFSQFMVKPSSAFLYLKDRSTFSEFVGHNPAGAYSIIALLTLMLTQAVSGLFISDEIFSDGPYYGVLDKAGQDIANFLHHNVYWLLFGFIALHVLAIIYYKIKYNEALTKSMITGVKVLSNKQGNAESFPWVGFVVSLLITALAIYLLVEVLPPAPSDDFYGY